ncbi:MAG: hypothetical protein R3C14_36725 [Caldilineaceae bacterium]
MENSTSTVDTFFRTCVEAIQSHRLIQRESRRDKEFHFQNWIQTRMAETGFYYEVGGRNSYPDFRMVNYAEGYEVKGLAYPGREATYDANSQVPSGRHNGRTVFYIFGRYPTQPDGDSYPVLDLVICHGDFLNADHDYIHKNRSVRGFGSYGDLLIRNRKMYVAPTPFGLVAGVAHTHTLILPAAYAMGADYRQVGELTRVEADRFIVSYHVDLRSNKLTSETVPNPTAGRKHLFFAWRTLAASNVAVEMRKLR